MAERIGQKQFEEKVLKRDGRVLLEFYSDSCAACKRMAPLLAQLEDDYTGLYIGKVHAGFEQELAQRYQVTSVPTLILLENGQELKRLTGAAGRQKLDDLLREP